MIKKIFEGEMLIMTLLTTLLRIFCKIILSSEFITKIYIDSDDNFQMNSSINAHIYAHNGQIQPYNFNEILQANAKLEKYLMEKC